MGVFDSLGLGTTVNVSSISSGIGAMLRLIGYFLMFAVPIALAVYFYYRWRQYPILVDIFTQRGTTSIVCMDKIGRFTSPTGVEKHRFMSLRRRNRTIEPIPFGQILVTNKGKNKAYLVENDNGIFYPVTAPIAGLSSNPSLQTEFKIMNRATKFWENLELKEKLSKYSAQKWWIEYFPHISFVMLAVFIILLFAMVKGDLAAVANSAAQAAEALGKAAASPPVGGAPGW